ncbi:MAG: YegS/Rv2252/BmrU family lipid kinase [Acutalibacteraceae bacterium]|nr:YegS/Rv2252/BmrU family lipid kinase [Acutalibacteraceae bacterium]
MKHVFIANPNAGQGKAVQNIYNSLSSIDKSAHTEVYLTKGKGDAENYIKQYMKKSNELVRFYACGGDGTIYEVVNGVAPFPLASFTVYPCGSGNDFVKTFGKKEDFLNIKDLVQGEEIPIDIIKVNDRFCINACHFGFDTFVARKMDELRSKPIIGGKNVYTTSVAMGLATGMRSKAEITVDGRTMTNGEFLLCTIANGQYVGGKYKCAPKAVVNDGFMEFCVAEPISRITFIRLAKYYEQGTHLEDKRFKDFLHYTRCKHVDIKAEDRFSVALDGEVIPVTKASVDIIHNGIKMALPKSIIKGKNLSTVSF